jgi:uncharacterized protein (TIGR02271 family)
LNLGDHLQPLSELGNYTIEKGDPDPRGWSVVSTEGHKIGKVEDLIVDTRVMKVRHLLVELDDDAIGAADDEHVVVDLDEVDVRQARREVFVPGYGAAGFGAAQSTGEYTERASTDRDQRTITRSEEELRIGKREVTRGEARVGKHVETERVSEPVTRRREEVVVERRPVEAGARADASIGEDEVRIPLMEEELVVEKRPVVKEELVVGKRVVEERDVVEADVRREEFDIDTNVASRKGTRRDGR